MKAVLSGIGVRGHKVPPKPDASTERERNFQRLGADPFEVVFTTEMDENRKPTDNRS